jgi:hypothetical protein
MIIYVMLAKWETVATIADNSDGKIEIKNELTPWDLQSL